MTPEDFPPPPCPACSGPMRLAASLPEKGSLPAVAGFVCDDCKREITLEIADD